MDAHSLIALFGQETGVPLALGESGTLGLAFDAGLTVQLEHDPGADALHCYVVLGRLPADATQGGALLRQLLQANAFCRDTDGATFGLDEATGDIILSRRLELARADTAWLQATLESMVAVAQAWQPRLAAAATTPAPAADAGAVLFAMPDPGMRA